MSDAERWAARLNWWAAMNSSDRTGATIIYNHGSMLVDGVVRTLCHDPFGKCPTCNAVAA
jgi:hypothetical protein